MTLKIRTNLAPALLQAATRLAVDAAILERAGPPPPLGEAPDPYHAASLGSILLAASFVEGGVNELFLQAVDQDKNVYPAWPHEAFVVMGEFWNLLEDQRAPTLVKAQVALSVARRATFDKGADPYQSAENLVRLRNALVHYKPEWNTDLDVHKDVEARLKAKFPENPFGHPSSVFFPHRCLGAGAALWSCRTAMAFIGALVERLEASSPLTKYIRDSREVLVGAA